MTLTRASGAIGVNPDASLIRSSDTAIRRVGLEPRLLPTGGGSDANILNDKGIEAVNLGVGYSENQRRPLCQRGDSPNARPVIRVCSSGM